MANETENPGLLSLARTAVAGVAENLAGTAQRALHKLEELAPAAVAGPVHSVVEAADALLPHAAHEPAAKVAVPEVKASPAPEDAAGAQAKSQAKPVKLSRPPEAPRAEAKPSVGGFKVKRGQKHRHRH